MKKTITDIIKGDPILSNYDYSMTYTIILRLITLGFMGKKYIL